MGLARVRVRVRLVLTVVAVVCSHDRVRVRVRVNMDKRTGLVIMKGRGISFCPVRSCLIFFALDLHLLASTLRLSSLSLLFFTHETTRWYIAPANDPPQQKRQGGFEQSTLFFVKNVFSPRTHCPPTSTLWIKHARVHTTKRENDTQHTLEKVQNEKKRKLQ